MKIFTKSHNKMLDSEQMILRVKVATQIIPSSLLLFDTVLQRNRDHILAVYVIAQ